MNILILINKNRITETLKNQLNDKTLSEKYNISYDFFLINPENIDIEISNINFQAYNACIIGGGDGTVRMLIESILDKSIPVIIMPLGTFNLLAKELNYPNDLDAIFAIIKNNKTKQIDLAEVNGKIIINHAWIGFYYSILKIRKQNRTTFGRSKFLKLIFNFSALFRRMPIYALKFKTDEKISEYKTCLVYVGNNASYTNLLDFGERKSLTSGLLAVTLLKCRNKWYLLWNILTILFTQYKDEKYVKEFTTDSLTIAAKTPFVNMVIDGELFKLKSPLQFINHQKKLTVFTL